MPNLNQSHIYYSQEVHDFLAAVDVQVIEGADADALIVNLFAPTAPRAAARPVVQSGDWELV